MLASSGLMSARDGQPLDVPPAPTGEASTNITDTSYFQNWADNSITEDDFEWQRATNSSFTQNLVSGTVAADSTSKPHSGLTPGETYYHRVRARNSVGNSDWSATGQVTLDSEPSAPNAPSGNTAVSTGETTGDQSWTDNSSDEDGFDVQLAEDSGFTVGVQSATKGIDVTSHSWSGLSAGTTYYTRVRAFNANGNSAWSNTDSFTTDGSPPAAPSNCSASVVSAGAIDVSWTDNSSDEDDFEVQYDTDSNFSAPSSEIVAADSTTTRISGLTEGTEYFFRVRARNAAGNSNWSNTADQYTMLKQPTNLIISDEGCFGRLTWDDNSSKEQNYEVWKDGALYDTIAADSTQYDVACHDAEGAFKVRAIHSVAPASNFSSTVQDTSLCDGCP